MYTLGMLQGVLCRFLRLLMSECALHQTLVEVVIPKVVLPPGRLDYYPVVRRK